MMSKNWANVSLSTSKTWPW